jgi:molecular chaperone HtpG
VFILEDTGQILPEYLRFVRGVVDSGDLPLNVSREVLQGSRAVAHIRSAAVKRVLKLLGELADSEPQKYATFWKEFGAVLKEGIPEDYANRDEITRLLRFTSTHSVAGEATVSLAGYVERMKEGQEAIYYLLAPTLAAARTSPYLEAFSAKGVEVLLLGETIDNWVVTNLREFDGKPLQSVAQGATDLGALQDEATKEATAKAGAEFAVLTGKLKQALGAKVRDVRVTSRLTTSPACIVADEPDFDFNPVRRLQGSGLPSQPVLEINPRHPLVERLNQNPDDPRLADWANVLYNQAILTLGARIDEPADFVTRLNELLLTLTAAQEPANPADPADSAGPGDDPDPLSADPADASADPADASTDPADAGADPADASTDPDPPRDD